MKKLIHILLAFALPLLTVTYGCGSGEEKVTPDSVFSVPYISSLSIQEPERALALIDTAEQEKLMTDFDVNRLRAVVYHNGFSDDNKALEYALKAYESPVARDNVRSYLRLLEMLASQYYLHGDYPQSMRFCTEGIQLAQDSLIKSSEANLNFSLGRNLLVLNREEEGFRYYRKAVDILDEESKRDGTWRTADDYIYRLAIWIGTLRNEERFDEAIVLLPRYEESVRRLESRPQIPDGLVDMRRASGYAMAAHLYAIKGEKERAHEQYLKLCATDYSKTPDAGQLIIPYLFEVGDYREALRQLQEEKKFWQANADTVSYSYIQNHLESELAIHEALGNLRAANRVLHTIQMLNDTLRARDRHEKALELAEIYKTGEQALQIERQSASILVRNIILAAAVLFLSLCIVFMVRVARYNRIVSGKNRSMVKTINELMGYKGKVFGLQEEVIRLQEKLASHTAAPAEEAAFAVPPSAVAAAPSSSNGGAAAVELTEFDRLLFDRLNYEVISRRLFLNPDFSKSSLLAEFPVPANKFSTFFKEYAGCTFSQYIHNCRLDYAVKLMGENPSWSMDAIAKAARMSNGSFYSQFKKKFGMSPSEYRKGEGNLPMEEE